MPFRIGVTNGTLCFSESGSVAVMAAAVTETEVMVPGGVVSHRM
jgi:hypothetical protein